MTCKYHVKQLNANHTMFAAFVGAAVQAVINNFAPLLFVTFQQQYHIPLAQITLLITFNFAVQLSVDVAAIRVVDVIGYRAAMVFAHGCCAVGLVLLAVLPALLSAPFWGLLCAVAVYAVGGGLLEVLISPIVEACPSSHKESAMSLLHSFYCWGHVATVLVSTLFFVVVGIERWQWLAVLWAMVPLANALFFTRVPLYSLLQEGEQTMSVRQILHTKLFWLLLLLMICAGASEQAVSQWASTFAEAGLSVNKTIGDLAGPTFFAVMMGVSRVFYGKYGQKIQLERFICGSTALAVASYLLIALSPWQAISLLGCGICGFSVGILWPGTLSIAARLMRRGGTGIFALLALGGDIGCSVGPTVVGFVCATNGNLQAGILSAICFPLVLFVGGLYLLRTAQL